jgi:hypothetical protein
MATFTNTIQAGQWIDLPARGSGISKDPESAHTGRTTGPRIWNPDSGFSTDWSNHGPEDPDSAQTAGITGPRIRIQHILEEPPARGSGFSTDWPLWPVLNPDPWTGSGGGKPNTAATRYSVAPARPFAGIRKTGESIRKSRNQRNQQPTPLTDE